MATGGARRDGDRDCEGEREGVGSGSADEDANDELSSPEVSSSTSDGENCGRDREKESL